MRLLETAGDPGFWGSFDDLVWWFLWALVFAGYLFALFAVLGDLLRDRALAGGWKALWALFLVLVPVLALVVYLLARGRGIGARSAAEAAQVAAGRGHGHRTSAAEEIARAKELLDAGAITPEEYETLKARALA
jgi:GNAT superfamily N-acetyltransferase